MKNQNYQTKTGAILAAIAEIMEIRPDEITIEEHIERANVATGAPAILYLLVAPRWKEDALMLIGAFHAVRNLLNMVAEFEGYVLEWPKITVPRGIAKQRAKASSIDVDELRSMAEKLSEPIFGASRVTVESISNFYELAIETPKPSKSIHELMFKALIQSIAKSRAVQIGVTFSSGRFVGEVER